jgi:hypothetical protein
MTHIQDNPMSIEKWQVYYLFCHHTKPVPKYKYITVAYAEDSQYIGFLINSQVNKFVRNRSYLMPCEVLIPISEHNFLSYDSYVDCRDAFYFDDSELSDFRGYLSKNTQQAVLNAIRVCPVLSRRIKKLVLS